MSSSLGTKINQILRSWPHGAIGASSWLEEHGAYPQLVKGYERSGWLERIGSGAYKKAGDTVDWQGALYSIQSQLALPITPAAKTALSLHGITQYVSLQATGYPVYLFGPPAAKLPRWFLGCDWGVVPRFVRTKLFGDNLEVGITEITHGTFSIRTSSRERAAIETCYLVPDQQSYEEARQLIEGLQTLRPALVQTLLELCQSIKAKRLFLHLAEACNLPWLGELDSTRIDLGKGKRSISPGGIYDPKYQIVVPKLHEGGQDHPERP